VYRASPLWRKQHRLIPTHSCSLSCRTPPPNPPLLAAPSPVNAVHATVSAQPLPNTLLLSPPLSRPPRTITQSPPPPLFQHAAHRHSAPSLCHRVPDSESSGGKERASLDRDPSLLPSLMRVRRSPSKPRRRRRMHHVSRWRRNLSYSRILPHLIPKRVLHRATNSLSSTLHRNHPIKDSPPLPHRLTASISTDLLPLRPQPPAHLQTPRLPPLSSPHTNRNPLNSIRISLPIQLSL
jgi:hypothetical protein